MNRAATWAAQAAALLALATLLAGCHTTRVNWAKPDGDTAALQNDMQACNYHYRPTINAPSYQAVGVPGYQPPLASTSFSTGQMTPAYPTPASSGDATKSATIDVKDPQRLAVNCMIAHGWRLTPVP